jgi:iron complex transport system substrate-binding protein
MNLFKDDKLPLPRRNRRLLVLLGLIWLLILSGCATAKPPVNGDLIDPPKAGTAQEGKTQNGQTTPASQAQATMYPLKVKDATGKEFIFDKAPARIVSISPSETETLFALGLGDQVVGVSDFCNYPVEALKKPKMGSIVKPSEEALLAAKADVVVTGVSMKAPAVEQLRSLNLNVFKVEPKTLDDVITNTLLLGQIFNKQEQAEKLAVEMKADRQKVADAVKGLLPEQKKRVLLEFSPGWTVGKGEFMDELITLAGGINIYGDTSSYSQLNEEKVIAANPQVILYSNNLIDEKSKKTLDQIIKERGGWEKLDAVRNNQVVGVNNDWISRPGPRLTKGLVDIAKGIYPELVK